MSYIDTYSETEHELVANITLWAKADNFFYRIEDEDLDDAAGFAFETVNYMSLRADKVNIDFSREDIVTIDLEYWVNIEDEGGVEAAIRVAQFYAYLDQKDIQTEFVRLRKAGEYDLSYAIFEDSSDLINIADELVAEYAADIAETVELAA